MNRIVLVFLDGVGLGAAAPDNPLATVETPALRALLGGPLTIEQVQRRDEVVLRAIDACLGVAGLPQSATGQTTLFTGINAARRMGRHIAAFPGRRLRRQLERHSVFRLLATAGIDCCYANALSPRFRQAIRSRRSRASATVWAIRAGGMRWRSLSDLRRGRALSWDVTRSEIVRHGGRAPVIMPGTAGGVLARLSGRHRLTLFETHLTDLVGHGRGELTATEVIARVDGLLGGLLAERTASTTVVVTSDHGNLEDSSHRRHTRNPVPLLAVGRAAAEFVRVRSLAGVVPALLRALAVGPLRLRSRAPRHRLHP